MAAKIYFFSGQAMWAKIYEYNRDEYLENEFTTIDVFLDKESIGRFKESGSRLTLRDNGSGEFVKFRRMWVNELNSDWGGVPEVVDVDGNTMTDLIGNGSMVTVKVCIYDSRAGKGTRLEGVRVDELVEYQSDGEVGEPEIADSGDVIPF